MPPSSRAAAPMLYYTRRPKPSAQAEHQSSLSYAQTPAAMTAPTPTPTRARKRKPSAKAEHQSSGKRLRKAAPSGKKPPAKARAPRKRARTGAKAAKKPVEEDDVCADEPDEEQLAMALAEEEDLAEQPAARPLVRRRRTTRPRRVTSSSGQDTEFVGEPVTPVEALTAWPARYQRRSPSRRYRGDDAPEARAHYRRARVGDTIYCLDEDVIVKAEKGEADYVGRITELFEGTDRRRQFACRWFYRPEETVIEEKVWEKVPDHNHDPKRVFISDEKDDLTLDCIISKAKIVHIDPTMNATAKAQKVADSEFYYDMSYTVAYSAFANIPSGNEAIVSDTASEVSSDNSDSEEEMSSRKLSLLDLYSGCGGMSTGLCLGAALAGVTLETRWAVDFNEFACKSMKYNHPNTVVRNEKAEEFLALLKEWAVLCDKHVNNDVHSDSVRPSEDEEENEEPLGEGEFVVEKLIDICYGGTKRKNTIYFKVQWQGYGPEEDSWEPIDNLSDCPLKIREFVQEGHRRKILPLPGDVDVLCGGPPCQGISGFNRYRSSGDPLQDDKNKQIVTFMDFVQYLNPKYVLMENVVDLLKFAGGYLGRYGLSRLLSLNYQARVGMMVAGGYGLPQFRMRVFLLGAHPSMVLPKYPLPTHNVVMRGGIPCAFSDSVVAYEETQKPTLKKALQIGEAISDLPTIENHQPNDVMDYGSDPKTDFESYVRLSRQDMLDYSYGEEVCPEEGKLLDHQPLRLNEDDLTRVRQIPKRKGANFRNLRGVRVGADNVVEFDPDIERVYLDSRKPLVPDYAMSFMRGRSLKPFGRLWGDETVPTVVTRAEPHNQIILHPEQDRVLSVRENARLQGFPDYYRMSGPIKQKYVQVGNAVAVPVARALGYSLGRAYQGDSQGCEPSLLVLPDSFTSMGQAAAVPAVDVPAGELVE